MIRPGQFLLPLCIFWLPARGYLFYSTLSWRRALPTSSCLQGTWQCQWWAECYFCVALGHSILYANSSAMLGEGLWVGFYLFPTTEAELALLRGHYLDCWLRNVLELSLKTDNGNVTFPPLNWLDLVTSVTLFFFIIVKCICITVADVECMHSVWPVHA